MPTPSDDGDTSRNDAHRLSVRDCLYGAFAPLLLRIRRGEGVLLAIVASVAARERGGPLKSGLAIALCTLVMAAMYLHNDRVDARRDRSNPRKDRRLSALLSRYDLAFAVLHGVALPALTAALWLVCGARAGASAAGCMLVNVAYSRWFKGIPLIDVLVVGTWGAAFAAIIDASIGRVVVVWLMTAISHVFQARLDRTSDERSGVNTTAVASPGLSIALIGLLGLLLAAWTNRRVGHLVSALGVAPLVACLLPNRAAGWILAKAAFAVLWIAYLVS